MCAIRRASRVCFALSGIALAASFFGVWLCAAHGGIDPYGAAGTRYMLGLALAGVSAVAALSLGLLGLVLRAWARLRALGPRRRRQVGLAAGLAAAVLGASVLAAAATGAGPSPQIWALFGLGLAGLAELLFVAAPAALAVRRLSRRRG